MFCYLFLCQGFLSILGAINTLYAFEPFGECLDAHAVCQCGLAHTGALQSCEVCTALQRFANVACQGAYIGAFTAYYADDDIRKVTLHEFYFIDDEGLGFELHLFALASQFVGALTIDHTG